MDMDITLESEHFRYFIFTFIVLQICIIFFSFWFCLVTFSENLKNITTILGITDYFLQIGFPAI